MPCIFVPRVDFNTLEEDRGEGAQEERGRLRTPAARLVAAVNDFFELFVSENLKKYSRDGLVGAWR